VRKLALFLIVLAGVQLACTESADDASPPEDTATEDPAHDPGPSGVLLTFTRSGGFAGTTETLTVRADGRAEVEGDASPPGRIEVPPELLTRLEEELQSLDWERAATEPQNVECADCFTYDIRAGERSISTTALGQSGEELSDLLALIEEILANSPGR
jgi:hypothetical protein